MDEKYNEEYVQEQKEPTPQIPINHPKIQKWVANGIGLVLLATIIFCLYKLFKLNVYAFILLLLLVVNSMWVNIRLDRMYQSSLVYFNALFSGDRLLSEAIQLQSKRITEISNGVSFGTRKSGLSSQVH